MSVATVAPHEGHRKSPLDCAPGRSARGADVGPFPSAEESPILVGPVVPARPSAPGCARTCTPSAEGGRTVTLGGRAIVSSMARGPEEDDPLRPPPLPPARRMLEQ